MDPIEKLKKITGKNHVWLTSRGNQSILQALLIAMELGKSEVHIPDQGGWLTYKSIPKLLGMRQKEIITKDAYFEPSDIIGSRDCALLVASLAGYFVPLPMDDLIRSAHQRGCVVIDDISGSIGREVSFDSDIVICSFGRWKPISLMHGGMVAISDDVYERLGDMLKEIRSLDRFGGNTEVLAKLIDGVKERQETFTEISLSIKKDLYKKYDIVHEDKSGINVVVSCKGKEMQDVIEYCRKKGYEYTQCPRYIRIAREGICIEVKRLR